VAEDVRLGRYSAEAAARLWPGRTGWAQPDREASDAAQRGAWSGRLLDNAW